MTYYIVERPVEKGLFSAIKLDPAKVGAAANKVMASETTKKAIDSYARGLNSATRAGVVTSRAYAGGKRFTVVPLSKGFIEDTVAEGKQLWATLTPDTKKKLTDAKDAILNPRIEQKAQAAGRATPAKLKSMRDKAASMLKPKPAPVPWHKSTTGKVGIGLGATAAVAGAGMGINNAIQQRKTRQQASQYYNVGKADGMSRSERAKQEAIELGQYIDAAGKGGVLARSDQVKRGAEALNGAKGGIYEKKKEEALTPRQQDAKRALRAAKASTAASGVSVAGAAASLASDFAARRNPAAAKALGRARNAGAAVAAGGFLASSAINYDRAKKAAEKAGVA